MEKYKLKINEISECNASIFSKMKTKINFKQEKKVRRKKKHTHKCDHTIYNFDHL